eukprot:1502521-Rhodomonas_salina.3
MSRCRKWTSRAMWSWPACSDSRATHACWTLSVLSAVHTKAWSKPEATPSCPCHVRSGVMMGSLSSLPAIHSCKVLSVARA